MILGRNEMQQIPDKPLLGLVEPGLASAGGWIVGGLIFMGERGAPGAATPDAQCPHLALERINIYAPRRRQVGLRPQQCQDPFRRCLFFPEPAEHLQVLGLGRGPGRNIGDP